MKYIRYNLKSYTPPKGEASDQNLKNAGIQVLHLRKDRNGAREVAQQ